VTSNPDGVIVYSDRETVKLDLDDIELSDVRKWSRRACEFFDLYGHQISESSKDCYHVIFDRSVSWSMNVRVMAWVCLMTHHEPLVIWFILQCRKGCSTLRITPKGDKAEPRIIERFGSQGNEIRKYLEYKNNIPRRARASSTVTHTTL
jgi:hypothetical protein